MATKKASTGATTKSVANKATAAKKTTGATAKSAVKAPSSLKLGSFTAKSVPIKPAAAKPAKPPASGRMVRVDMELTEKQKADLEKLTGKKVQSLRLTVQDLADLANVILN